MYFIFFIFYFYVFESPRAHPGQRGLHRGGNMLDDGVLHAALELLQLCLHSGPVLRHRACEV